jgi:c(7)-type cytochrome triheme protein
LKHAVTAAAAGLALCAVLLTADAILDATLERSEVSRAAAEDEKHGGIIVFEVKKNKQELVHSLFSHQLHIDSGHTCNDCHNDKVFKRERKLGVNKFTMKDVLQGKACGSCHNGRTQVKGKTVFAPQNNCTRCHTVKFRKRAGA